MKIALITGASSGMGVEFVKQLDREGLDELWLVARREDRLNSIAAECKSVVRVIALDLLKEDACAELLEMAKRCEAAGVSFITVHARTKVEMYQPGIDMDIIKAVKQAVNIPVIGNGDITCPEDAIRMMDYTGCDYVMVGREALSRPWIFRQIKEALDGKPISADLTVSERMELLLWHVKQLCEVNGEYLGMKKSRGQAALYMKGLRGAAHLRYLTNSLSKYEDAENLVKEVLKENV
jgi:tRNA-dihydrouridine synthase